MYYIYHIKGKKWGCTTNLKRRLKEQKIKKADEVIKENNIDTAADLEKELNLKYGYPWNDSQDYRIILTASKSLTLESRKDISKKLKERWKQGIFNDRNIDYKSNGKKIKKWYKENKDYYLKRSPRGELSGTNKLTEETVKQIRKEYIPHVFGYNKISDKFNIHPQTAIQIIKRKTWTHI